MPYYIKKKKKHIGLNLVPVTVIPVLLSYIGNLREHSHLFALLCRLARSEVGI